MPLPPDVWPLFGLRVRTPRLELRVPIGPDVEALTALAADGIHEPGEMPFLVPWTDVGPVERARNVLRWHWGCWARWEPDDWTLDLAVLVDGEVVGTQGISARDFARLREVATGSWLGRAHQGRGIGTEMRAAVLHLAFEGLGACRSWFVISERFGRG